MFKVLFDIRNFLAMRWRSLAFFGLSWVWLSAIFIAIWSAVSCMGLLTAPSSLGCLTTFVDTSRIDDIPPVKRLIILLWVIPCSRLNLAGETLLETVRLNSFGGSATAVSLALKIVCGFLTARRIKACDF